MKKTSSLDREIRNRIESFTGDLTKLVRTAALGAVHSVLGGSVEPVGAPAADGGAGTTRRRRKGGKRSSDDVNKTADALRTYIKSHEGQRLDQIAKGLGTTTKDLKLPVQKLFAAKAIKTKGQKRGTKYFAR